jgi:serine/threonine-protein kinase RsbW
VSQRRLHLVIDSDVGNVALLGESTRAACVAVGLSATAAAEVELSVVEAVNNAIEHSYRTGSGEVRVTLTEATDAVEIEVRDRGEAMPAGILDRAAALTFDPDKLQDLPEGGMGLGIVKDLMEDVRYESRAGENVLSMRRRR